MSSEGLILVTGGTGGLGHRVVPRLVAAGRTVRVLSRKPHAPDRAVEYMVGDLVTGVGVEAAVAGVDVVLHCAATGRIKKDTAQARNLVRAAQQAGVRHLINISVVGADRIPVKSGLDRSMFGYFAGQRAVESAFEESGIPWTNLRATQFYDGFMLVVLRGMSKLPVIPVPRGVRFQPVDTDDVAAELARLTLGEPVGEAPAIAGPKTYTLDELLRSYLKAVGKRRCLLPIRVPGAAAAAIRGGANLAPDRAVGTRTWEEYLADLSGQPSTAARAAT
ncbi:MAG TPA: NAD(P)H-binding protein [Mycobacterium sp.]|uniref:SDR family oxidoreductase n=1 Tax=Mycobacterium sp. TaxID=1785 RepID=UPI002D6551A2|nr:NAD(P)H-binding protein [Mycobacterium sp.]HZU47366.1 NAD(P)H-binding protein [Mycobacterium sp.]